MAMPPQGFRQGPPQGVPIIVPGGPGPSPIPRPPDPAIGVINQLYRATADGSVAWELEGEVTANSTYVSTVGSLTFALTPLSLELRLPGERGDMSEAPQCQLLWKLVDQLRLGSLNPWEQAGITLLRHSLGQLLSGPTTPKRKQSRPDPPLVERRTV